MRTISLLPGLLLLATTAIAKSLVSPAHQLQKRTELQTCSDLTVNSNNGNRKVVIVIDRSGSMSSADPDDLRLAAGQALNDFLISNKEATGGKKADQVAVVAFDSFAETVFGPGDPGDPAANAAIADIKIRGGTYIAEGVYTAMNHIAAMSGETKDRSAIVVFTDGSDSDTAELVSAITNATSQGIRVSFGYLDYSASAQPTSVLRALRDSKGVYATITLAAGSQNFINYVLLNGLTAQDNPQGAGDRLLAGLATTQFISGSDAVTLKYSAEKGENANFTAVSFTGDKLVLEAKMGGKTFQSITQYATTRQFVNVTAPSNGILEVVIKANNSPKDGLFSILTNSNQPIKNCTVGVGGKKGLTAGAKAGVGIGVVAAVAALAGAAFYGYKHFIAGAGAAGGAGVPPPPGVPTGPSGMEGGYHNGPSPLEKLQPMANVSPVGAEGPLLQSMPPGNTGFEAQGIPPNGTAPPGPGPLSNMPPPPPSFSTPMNMPITGIPPAGPGTAFIPPMVPPPIFKNSSSDRPGSSTNQNNNIPPDNNTASFLPPGSGGVAATAGAPFPVPGPPSLQQTQKQNHHHHPWLAPDMACEHPECPLNLEGHECVPDKKNCLCTCRDRGCLVGSRWM
ncbi:von Willebrand factor type A domain-containing protein [Podospora fimiseda]|uniref:von Willebrand factor type A domain-containing protein n=1 Tax=Podospora fimiseda TaxID=252190 RepID=A0AAN7H221_9PEZI|nr:von Willebrand factor type A domain-containing protein [Podospora fimiseda]